MWDKSMKTCSKCHLIKTFDQFQKKNSTKDGYQTQCKKCRKEYTQTYFSNNKLKIQKANRKRYQLNKEKYLEGCKKYRNSIKEERKAFYLQLKTAPCMDCGNTFDPECMDFDHRPDEIKLFEISQFAGGGQTRISKNKILAEIKKCDLICSNCHRLHTKIHRAHGRN
jgi:hypothetical protein